MSDSESASQKKNINMGDVTIALPKKMMITTQPTVATARGTKLKPAQHSLVFLEHNMSQRSSTGVNLQPIPIWTNQHIFFQNFTLLFLAAVTNLVKKIAFRGRTLFDPASMPAREMLKLILKAIFITECHDTKKCPGSEARKKVAKMTHPIL